jgi:hypothetical protein
MILSDCAESDQLSLSQLLINSQLSLMGLDPVAYKKGPSVRFKSV